jgi:hypothetical protein
MPPPAVAAVALSEEKEMSIAGEENSKLSASYSSEMELEKEAPYLALQAAIEVMVHTYKGEHYVAYQAAIAISRREPLPSTTQPLPDIRSFLVEVTLLQVVPEIVRAMSLPWDRHSGINVLWLPLIETLSNEMKLVPVSPGIHTHTHTHTNTYIYNTPTHQSIHSIAGLRDTNKWFVVEEAVVSLGKPVYYWKVDPQRFSELNEGLKYLGKITYIYIHTCTDES